MKVKSFYFLFILLHNKSRNLKELGILRTSLFEKRSEVFFYSQSSSPALQGQPRSFLTPRAATFCTDKHLS